MYRARVLVNHHSGRAVTGHPARHVEAHFIAAGPDAGPNPSRDGLGRLDEAVQGLAEDSSFEASPSGVDDGTLTQTAENDRKTVCSCHDHGQVRPVGEQGICLARKALGGLDGGAGVDLAQVGPASRSASQQGKDFRQPSLGTTTHHTNLCPHALRMPEAGTSGSGGSFSIHPVIGHGITVGPARFQSAVDAGSRL